MLRNKVINYLCILLPCYDMLAGVT